METYVENVIQSYFLDHRAVAFEGADFVRFEGFEWVRTVNTANVRSKLTVGRIVYRIPSAAEPSYKNLLVRYSEEATDTPLSCELCLWQTLLPLLHNCKPIMHLFLELRVGCATATPPPPYGQWASTRNAAVWELPAQYVPFAQISTATFDIRRCSLMVRAIAEFHASSLYLHITNSAKFENLNATYAADPPYPFVDPLLKTLRRCLEPLRSNWLCAYSRAPFHEAVTRLEKMLNNFAKHVRAPFVRDQTSRSCWVVCHRNYGRQSVVFEPDPAGKPAQVRIFNCQSMGFASLGVDLAILLFVELPKAERVQHYHEMLSYYCAQLEETIGKIEEPTVPMVHREIAMSIPYALYVLATRIVDARAETQPGTVYFQPNQWTEDLLTNFYYYVVDNGFVWYPPFSEPTSSANQ